MSALLFRRWWLAGLLFVAVLVVAVVLARRELTGLVLGRSLRNAGAEDVRFAVTAASPWTVRVEDLGFALREQRFAARRVTADRDHWWTPRFSAVRVEGAEIGIRAADLRSDDAASAASTDFPAARLRSVPLGKLSVDGTVSVAFEGEDREAFAVSFVAEPVGDARWNSQLIATAPGSRVEVELELDLAAGRQAWRELRGDFDLARAGAWLRRAGLAPEAWPELAGMLRLEGEGTLDGTVLRQQGRLSWRDGMAGGEPAALELNFAHTPQGIGFAIEEFSGAVRPWLGMLRNAELLPAEIGDLGGTVSAAARGWYHEGVVKATADVRWREGALTWTQPEVTASGIAADFHFEDVAGFVSSPGVVRVAAVTASGVTASHVEVEAAWRGPDAIDIRRGGLEVFGGRVEVEPFVLHPARAEADVVFGVTGLSIEEVLALTRDVPARASGRVNGRVPVRFGPDGLSFGVGWLELQAGAPAQLQLEAEGLLTAGVAPGSPRHDALKRIESGMLRLNLSRLRLDLWPPGEPADRSATLQLAGEPADATIKAPVNLTVNINGPVEQLLRIGMDQRLRFGGPR